MSRTVYVKFTLENDSDFESMSLEEVATWFLLCLGPSCIGGPDVTVWDSLNDTMADEVDFEALLGKAIDESTDAFESWNVGTQSEDPPTVAGTLIDLLKNGVYDGK